MKRILTYLSFILLLPLIVSAQSRADSIAFTVKITNVGCKHSSLGSAEINVVNKKPPYSYLWNTGEITPMIKYLEPGLYFVKVTDGSGNDTIVKIPVQESICEMEPEVIFTPNGDGYNDAWYISNSGYYPNALILVYNRWGQKIFEHSGLYEDPWDGEDRLGAPVPDATYFYVIYQDRKNEKELKKGSVSIIR